MQIPQTPTNNKTGWTQNTLGIITLVLIFCASASFAWAYFADTGQPQSPVQVAAAAVTQAASTPSTAFDNVSLQAHGAIVIDETTGQILYQFNPDIQWPLASLTKVALVLVVSSVLPQDTIITMPSGVPHFAAGTQWELSDIINYTLAISSNQGADVLAQTADSAVRAQFPEAPAQNATVWRMNQLVKSLGLTHTYFLNDNGLDISTTQSGAYGSPRDVATLMAYAASSTPQTFAATTLQSFNVESIGSDATALAVNTDEALPAIPGIIMGKTGYTDLAGGNLAVVFQENGHEIIAVVMGSTETGRFDDMKALVADVPQAITQE